ncbi:MAG: DUF4783 domain-containing protein [Sphingobacteriales bacterium]|nr:MAG: DUF4783 domain-containing protein [Sphingobacteriales bacterium]
MKQLYKRAFLLLSILTFLTLAPAKGQVLEDMSTYIRNGNVASMTKYFDNIVTINISSNQSSYSKAQAEIILKDFFGKTIVKDFVVMQTGTAPNNNCKYAIGTLSTNTADYQLYFLLKLKGEGYLLQEMRIENK